MTASSHLSSAGCWPGRMLRAFLWLSHLIHVTTHEGARETGQRRAGDLEGCCLEALASIPSPPSQQCHPKVGLRLGSDLLTPHHMATGRRREQAIPRVSRPPSCPALSPRMSCFPSQAKGSLILSSWLCLIQGPALSRCLIRPNSSAEGEADPTLVQPFVNLTGRKGDLSAPLPPPLPPTPGSAARLQN